MKVTCVEELEDLSDSSVGEHVLCESRGDAMTSSSVSRQQQQATAASFLRLIRILHALVR